MGVLDFIRGNSVERLNTRELKEEEMRLQNHVELARKEITKIEKQKKDIFKQGVGADLIQKKILAQKLKQLDMQAQLKFRGFMTMNKEYMFISNLVVIKQYEKELKQSPIWSKITNIEPVFLRSPDGGRVHELRRGAVWPAHFGASPPGWRIARTRGLEGRSGHSLAQVFQGYDAETGHRANAAE